MTSNTYQLPLTFDKILILVQQLTKEEQIKLKQEIDKRINAQEDDFFLLSLIALAKMLNKED